MDPFETDADNTKGRRTWILIAAGLIAVSVAVLVLWWFIDQGSATDEPEGEMALIAVVVDDRTDIGRMTMHLSPGASGENELWFEVAAAEGGPLDGIDHLSVDVFSHTDLDESWHFELELDDDGESRKEELDLGDQQFLQVDVSVPGAELTEPAASFVFLVPDPNVHGMERIETVESDPDAEALYQRGMVSLTSLHRLRYVQPLADGLNGAVVSYREINDGSDGSPAGFTYFTPGGLDAVVIEDELWSRTPGEAWRVRDSSPFVPPSEWGEEYNGATGFQFGPELEFPAGTCRVVTFVTPEIERRAVAWYSWCVDEETGYVLRDAMIARNHYMITDYSDFDGDIVISAPIVADATPNSG